MGETSIAAGHVLVACLDWIHGILASARATQSRDAYGEPCSSFIKLSLQACTCSSGNESHQMFGGRSERQIRFVTSASKCHLSPFFSFVGIGAVVVRPNDP